MNVHIKSLGLTSVFLKNSLNSVDLPEGSTVEDLLSSIVITEEGTELSLLKAATFLVNKENANRETILNDGDEIIIMLRMAGG